MNRPEGVYNELVSQIESKKTPINPNRPFLEKLGSALILTGAAGTGLSIMICTTSMAPFISPEDLHNVRLVGVEVIKGTSVIIASGVAFTLLGKITSSVLDKISEVYSAANSATHRHP